MEGGGRGGCEEGIGKAREGFKEEGEEWEGLVEFGGRAGGGGGRKRWGRKAERRMEG